MKHIELFESDEWLEDNSLNENRQAFLENGVYQKSDVEDIRRYDSRYGYNDREIYAIIAQTEEGYDGLESLVDMLKNDQLIDIAGIDVRRINNAISQKSEVLRALRELKNL